MGCESCKNKGASDSLNLFIKNKNKTTKVVETKQTDIGFRIFNILIRLFLFGISLALVPIILLFVVYLLFKTIILNKGEINLMPALLKLANGIGIGRKKRNVDENPDDYEDLDTENPDDYEFDEKVDRVEL
jgi:hypothetical protein